MYLLSICTWCVAEIEFRCPFALFVISNNGMMRCQLAANLKGRFKANNYSDETGELPPTKRRGRRWGVLYGKEEYTEGIDGAQNEKSAKSRLRSTNWD